MRYVPTRRGRFAAEATSPRAGRCFAVADHPHLHAYRPTVLIWLPVRYVPTRLRRVAAEVDAQHRQPARAQRLQVTQGLGLLEDREGVRLARDRHVLRVVLD